MGGKDKKIALLTRERDEALAKQTATADILRIISQSPTDVRPVFDSIVFTAVRLLRCDLVFVLLCDGATYSPAAVASPEGPLADVGPTNLPIDPSANFPSRAILDKKMLHLPDWSCIGLPEHELKIHKMYGVNSALYLPLLREGECIGLLTLVGKRPNIFGALEIAQAESFRDQALIAIVNARLFNETKEALEQQTATSEVLRIINSSPGNLEPVFATMLANAVRLCRANFGNIYRWDDDAFNLVAAHNTPPALVEYRRRSPYRPSSRTPLGRLIATKTAIHVVDAAAEQVYTEQREPGFVATVELGGIRTYVAVPLIKENELVGLLTVYRQEVRPFTDKQIELVTSFANQAVIAIENARLLNELRQRTSDLTEALEQQTATSEVLQVISSSPGELQPVFEVMLEKAARICDATFGNIYRRDGDVFRLVATQDTPPAFAEVRRRSPTIYPDPRTPFGRMVESKAVIHIADLAADIQQEGIPEYHAALELGGIRTVLAVPMIKDDELIGAFIFSRQEVRPFTENQIELVQNFAAQAVIAIENTRLLNELRESLQQQTATADVLKAISRSTFDLQAVLDTLVESAARLCEAETSFLFRRDGAHFMWTAGYGHTPEYLEQWKDRAVPPSRGSAVGRAAAEGKIVHIPDVFEDPEYTSWDSQKAGGYRSVLGVPLLREGIPIGVLGLTGSKPQSFSDKHIELVTTFADQAVIAIENVRLFEAEQQRTQELTESLDQQTATSKVLDVISRSAFDLKAVFETVAESSVRLCGAHRAFIYRFDGELLRLAVAYNTPEEFEEFVEQNPIRPGRHTCAARTALERQTIHITDILADPEYTFGAKAFDKIRTVLGVPILKGDDLLGVMIIYHEEVRPFTDSQIALVETFADQAAIAIENVRLLDELRRRTDDLSESLEQQTATSEVLQVISSSPGELEPVFDSMLANATKLCEATHANVWRFDGQTLHIAAVRGDFPFVEWLRQHSPVGPIAGSAAHRLVRGERIVYVADRREEEAYRNNATFREMVDTSGVRASLSVALRKDETLLGMINVYRQEVRPFSDKQIALLENFAAQAVIAIENARLLTELRQRTADLSKSLQQQTATADVLKVISRSTFDLRTVLQTLLESAARFCDADKANIIREKDGVFYTAEAYGYSGEFLDYMKNIPIKAERGSASGRALVEGRVVHITDVAADPEYTLVEGARLGDYRTVLCVPMLREGVPIGLLVLTRSEVQPFTDEQIELVTTFADQAAIAIENMRLFEAEQQRTHELANSLEDLRSAQDRLVQTQKLASLGQLTAGIAHEIKNPLNFVNNFSGVSAELIDELQETLGKVKADANTLAEITELTDTLRDNLDKIVQHGKRADSIVKNMLLHSREGSGEHRHVNINALVEESLNLAYHGARAEQQGFKITLERSFDPAAGEIDAFPQEITRALLNLISNGFYAATKREERDNSDGCEPALTVATKGLGDRVEITIRDNGIGIPPEVREKMFNPFFTTKPAGEGTGLGLSITHDIIVKQHVGSIEVDTRPGEFTEVRIILSRAPAFPQIGG